MSASPSADVVYHFSEEPDIAVFRPRVPAGRPEVQPLVWAIDAWHAPLYYFPRDCPRVLYWPLPSTTPEDRARHWDAPGARMVACVEERWRSRLDSTRLYRYVFDAAGFEDLADAGMLVHRGTVVPRAVEAVGPLPAALHDAGVELRVLPSLVPLLPLWQTTLHASGIRLRHAVGFEGHAGSAPPPSIAR